MNANIENVTKLTKKYTKKRTKTGAKKTKEVNILNLLKSQNKKKDNTNFKQIIENTNDEYIKEYCQDNVFQISCNNITIIAYDVIEKEKFVLRELIRFYDKDKLEKIKPLINQEHDISLRLIDWTPTNYSKKKCIKYQLSNDKIIDIYESYKNYMSSYKRNILFDLFRRGKCLKVIYGGSYIISSVKQLNSFRWVLEIDLLTYIAEHKEEIEEDHRRSLRRSATNKTNKNRKQRQELSSSIYKKCLKHNYKITITF